MDGLPDMTKPKQWRAPEIGHISLLPITLNLKTIRCAYVYVVKPNEEQDNFIIETYLHPKELLFSCSPQDYSSYE